MKTAIVTGATRFIGRALIQELIKNHYKIYAIGRRKSSEVFSNNENVTFICCDLRCLGNLEQILPTEKYDCFFHLAWEGVTAPLRDNVELQLLNIKWTIDALRIASKLGCRRFICAGTIMVQEATANMLMQRQNFGSCDIYSGAKLASHILCRAVASQLSVDMLWVKLVNIYGPGDDSSRLIDATLRKCLRGESPRFTAGTQNYDFVYISDAARAFRLIAEKGKPFHEYIIGSSSAQSLKDFLLEMQQAVSPNIPYEFGQIDFKGVSLPLSEFDCTQTEADTGFRAEVSFAEGCRRTVEWIKADDAAL